MSNPPQSSGATAKPAGQGFGVFVKKKATTAPKPPKGPTGANPTGPKDGRKRWLVLAAGAALVLVVLTSLSNKDNATVQAQKPKDAGLVDVTPKNENARAVEFALGKDVETLKQQMTAATAQNAALSQAVKDMTEELRKTQQAAKSASPADNSGGLGTLSPGRAAGTPEPPMPIERSVPGALKLPPSIPTGQSSGLTLPSSGGAAGGKRVFDAPADSAAPAKPDAEVKVTYTKNPNAGAFTLGFAPVALLYGIDAGTSASSQSNPLPVLMNLQDHMTLPGLAKFAAKNCFALGSAHGELSSERVHVRISRISCMDKQNKLSATAETAGVLVDSDGQLGLRGKLVDRQGARLAKSTLAGIAQGVTQVFAQGQSTVTTSPLTGATTSSLSGNAVARAAGLTGAQTAAAQLADFYLKEAQAIFPVLEVGAGRTATIAFTGTTKLVWQSTEDAFVKTVTPTNR